MARMLQALKNLEARTNPRPAPHQPAAASAPVAEKSPELPSVPALCDLHDPAIEVTTQIDFAAAALANLSVSVSETIWAGPGVAAPLYEVATAGPPEQAPEHEQRLPAAVSSLAPVTPPASKAALSGRGGHALAARIEGHRATPFEKAALRVLTDPIRARPLVELAERLEADVKQTLSRTILLAGVGTADDVATTLLFTGILMTERQAGDVLLVDANWPGRSFSAALEHDRQRGLGELIDETASIAEVCHPTATGRLFFLPAGQRRNVDLSTAGTRLEAALKKLAGRFALVLIDGGHSGELACSALARHADATYLVVRLGAVEAAAAQTALRDLRASGARVLGTIAT